MRNLLMLLSVFWFIVTAVMVMQIIRDFLYYIEGWSDYRLLSLLFGFMVSLTLGLVCLAASWAIDTRPARPDRRLKLSAGDSAVVDRTGLIEIVDFHAIDRHDAVWDRLSVVSAADLKAIAAILARSPGLSELLEVVQDALAERPHVSDGPPGPPPQA